MSGINEKVLGILGKIEKQVRKSIETMEKHKDENIEDSARTRNHWMHTVISEYSSINKILAELPEALKQWANEQMEKRK
jgi:hypothetical protein